MPLSEHEKRMLKEIEQSLYAEDPQFASQIGGNTGGGAAVSAKSLAGGIALLVLGLFGLLGGVVSQQPIIGGVGFVLMLAGAWVMVMAFQRRGATPQRKSKGKKSSTKQESRSSRSSFMQRVEDRWQRRRDHS